MAILNNQYPKLLAFLQLFYPTLYQQLCPHSKKADIVEANLICSNNTQAYQAIVYSEDVAKDGESFKVYSGKDFIAPYSWDWRWVFAVKIVFIENTIFVMKFKQKVIALPTGKHPLTDVFFNIIQDEFKEAIDQIIDQSSQQNIPVDKAFYNYLASININNTA